TSGKDSAQLFLVGSREIEARQVGPGIYILSTNADKLRTAGDHLVDGLVRIDRLMRLVDIGRNHCLAHLEGACIGSLHPLNQPEKCRFPGTVRADYTDNPVGWKREIEVVKQQLLAVCLPHILR